MHKPARYLVALGLLSQLFIACKKDDEQQPSTEQPLTVAEVNGYVQKGPFVIGTNISVSELDKGLAQTGKSFNANIKDDQGAFSIKNLKLTSKYVELRASGFYFNEVTGKLSTSPLTLSALADVSSTTSVNVNMLTHLEKGRVEYLMSKGKHSFEEAKKQAQKEILTIFNINKGDITSSEQLNIAQTGEDNAILLALSAILQGTRTESELSELLSKISLDIQEDGTLDNTSLQSALINEATLLKTDVVKANVTKRYADLGLTVTVGNFQKYVQDFVNKSAYTFTKKIQYPPTGQYGVNLLTSTADTIRIPKRSDYKRFFNPYHKGSLSIAALAPAGTKLRVKLNLQDTYGIAVKTSNTWKVINGNELEITQADALADAELEVETWNKELKKVRLEVYENGALQPTMVKNLVFVGDNSLIAGEKISMIIHGTC